MKKKTIILLSLLVLVILPLAIILVGSPSYAQDTTICPGSGATCIVKKGIIKYNAEKDKDGPSLIVVL